MTRHFQKEIEKLKKMIMHLTAMVEGCLHKSVRAYIERDVSVIDEIRHIDDEIDQYEVDVEEESLKILALHQPVAADLRFVIAVLKINNDLERIGDLALNIAKRIKNVAPFTDREAPFDLNIMLEKTIAMVKKSADALVEWDVEKANQVCADDNEVDDIHKSAYDSIQKHIKEEPDFVNYYISLLSVSRNLERIADHATNIAEDVIYMVSGEIIRHQGEV